MKIIIVASSPVKTFKETYHRNPSDYFIGIDGGSLHELTAGIVAFAHIGCLDGVRKEDCTAELDILAGLIVVNGESFGLRETLLRLSVVDIDDRSGYGKCGLNKTGLKPQRSISDRGLIICIFSDILQLRIKKDRAAVFIRIGECQRGSIGHFGRTILTEHADKTGIELRSKQKSADRAGNGRQRGSSG